jgi:hypothetical protein
MIFSNINAQRYNIGVRAGINYSVINGPAEEGMMEGSNFNSGINFGITYAYKLTDRFGIKTELSYANVGSSDSIVGESFYNFGIGSANQIREGYIKKNLEVSNSYINIPIHAYFYPIKKLELFGGPYVAFLINPAAAGRLLFDDQNEDTKFGFIQTLDYDYYSDNAKDVGSTRNLYGTQTLSVIIDERIITMPRVVGAYYQFAEKDGGLYKWFDWGLSVGAHYYINKSFYMGGRVDYGLFDITRTKMDVSYRMLDGGQYILRDDRDTNLSIQASVGFKF